MKIFDLHLDLEVYYRYPEFLNMTFKSLEILDTKRHGDIPQFLKSNLKIAVVNIFPFEFKKNKWEPININKFFERLESFVRWIKKFDVFEIILNRDDLKNNLKNRRIGIILGVEGLNFINKIEDIYKIYESGIRVFGLNWNIDSKFSTSLKTITKSGLTKEGKALIKILEKLPIVIDLAHSSIYTSKDVFKYYKKPIIFSHNGIQKIVNFEQNLSDDLLDNLNKNKGLIGLTCLPYSINLNGEISFKIWHQALKYAKDKYKNNLAIGTDFFGFKFNKDYKGLSNYLDFYKNLKKFKVPKYILFNNSCNLFLKSL